VIQENKLILGFSGLKDLASCLFGVKNLFFNFITITIATLTTFITEYIWDDAKAVYFMLFLIAIDAATGIWKAYTFKRFSSSRLPRIFVISIIYVLMLAISWNSAKYSELFLWLPSMVYGGLMGTLIVSIYENFAELGYLPKGLLYDIKDRIKDKLNKKNQ
jgi:phage-related holin